MKIQEIMQFISALRGSKKKVITNYYLTLQKSEEDFECWTAENSIVFCAQENKVYRCFFATTDTDELNILLEKVPAGTVMDIISKEKPESFLQENPWWTASGFEHYSTLVRHINPDLFAVGEKSKRDKFLEQFYQEDFGEFSTPDDADELYDLLYEIFDYRVSRLPSMEELLEQISKNWVLHYREDGKIIAFLMYQIEGKKYYGYQIYNKGTADITYNLECRAIRYAIEHYGVKSSYAWIEINNSAANRRADSRIDGTFDYIFIKK